MEQWKKTVQSSGDVTHGSFLYIIRPTASIPFCTLSQEKKKTCIQIIYSRHRIVRHFCGKEVRCVLVGSGAS